MKENVLKSLFDKTLKLVFRMYGNFIIYKINNQYTLH